MARTGPSPNLGPLIGRIPLRRHSPGGRLGLILATLFIFAMFALVAITSAGDFIIIQLIALFFVILACISIFVLILEYRHDALNVHENGVSFSRNPTCIPYDNVTGLTFSNIAFIGKSGVNYRLELEWNDDQRMRARVIRFWSPEPATMATEIRLEVSLRVAERMMVELSETGFVEWTPWLRLSIDGLHYRPPKSGNLFGKRYRFARYFGARRLDCNERRV